MPIQYSGRSNRRDSKGLPPEQAQKGLHFCFCCTLCYLLTALLIGLIVFYFLEQVSTRFHSLFTPSFGIHPIEVSVASDNPVIGVCVRDFGCEDGDRAELVLDTEVIFRGELFREATCMSNLRVHEGKNQISLKALNGSGGKGGCPNDINTGEVTVIGLNQQTYGWYQLAGETASADVEVRLEDP